MTYSGIDKYIEYYHILNQIDVYQLRQAYKKLVTRSNIINSLQLLTPQKFKQLYFKYTRYFYVSLKKLSNQKQLLKDGTDYGMLNCRSLDQFIKSKNKYATEYFSKNCVEDI